jgi:hypothetical protein
MGGGGGGGGTPDTGPQGVLNLSYNMGPRRIDSLCGELGAGGIGAQHVRHLILANNNLTDAAANKVGASKFCRWQPPKVIFRISAATPPNFRYKFRISRPHTHESIIPESARLRPDPAIIV